MLHGYSYEQTANVQFLFYFIFLTTHHVYPNNKTKTRKSEEQATERTIPYKTDPKNTEDQPDTRQPEQALNYNT
jgi:hypothetical protein